MRLAAGMEHRPFSTVDAAIRAAFPPTGGPLDARGIDYGHVGGGTTGPWELEARLDRIARVRAIVGQLDDVRQRILIAYAWGLSYRVIARELHVTSSTVHRWHRRDWDQVRERLQAVGLLDSSWG